MVDKYTAICLIIMLSIPITALLYVLALASLIRNRARKRMYMAELREEPKGKFGTGRRLHLPPPQESIKSLISTIKNVGILHF